jgi:hypothetical protein
MIANRTLVGRKCAAVIEAYAELANIPIREAFDVFYKSNLYTEIRNGISDMHCRSDGYLAEELLWEVNRTRPWGSAPYPAQGPRAPENPSICGLI